jgi:uncharacterized protein (DUF2252 family)
VAGGANSSGRSASVSERAARGRALREAVPRAAHAGWRPPPDRPDPSVLLAAQDRHRVPELVPLRQERMRAGPFAFLRGSAIVMAHDLAATPATGIYVEACGDAHLSNFGLFGTPERNLVFDVNDFDETLPAPWEWDVKRLVTSFVVAARGVGHSPEQCSAAARAAVESYRAHIREMGGWRYLDVWYSAVTAEEVERSMAVPAKQAEASIARARADVPAEEMAKVTELVKGEPRLREHPPLVSHQPEGDTPESLSGMATVLANYAGTLEPERRVLFGRYRLVDAARKVVGVGSVGTRCAVALLLGASDDDPLFLQVKQAQASVLEAVAGPSPLANHAERVVRGQRLCQAASDLFLGWVHGRDGRDYYVRQLADMKGSVDAEVLPPGQLAAYARACGWVLARAHARSGDPAVIGGYLGAGPAFDDALVTFATRYADQVDQDFAAFARSLPAVAARRPGRRRAGPAPAR